MTVSWSPLIPTMASTGPSSREAARAPEISPSSMRATRAPTVRTAWTISLCRGRSMIAMVRSDTCTSLAKAMRRRLAASGSERSSAPRATAEVTIVSMYQTAGSQGKAPGSTATTAERAPEWPFSTRPAPSTG